MQHANRQKGIGFLGLLVLLIVFGFLALMGLKMVPMYLESFKIDQALKGVIEDPNVGKQSKRDIIVTLLKRLDIDDVRRINERNYSEHLEVVKEGERVSIIVDYRREEPLISNLSLVADFHKEVRN